MGINIKTIPNPTPKLKNVPSPILKPTNPPTTAAIASAITTGIGIIPF